MEKEPFCLGGKFGTRLYFLLEIIVMLENPWTWTHNHGDKYSVKASYIQLTEDPRH